MRDQNEKENEEPRTERTGVVRDDELLEHTSQNDGRAAQQTQSSLEQAISSLHLRDVIIAVV